MTHLDSTEFHRHDQSCTSQHAMELTTRVGLHQNGRATRKELNCLLSSGSNEVAGFWALSGSFGRSALDHVSATVYGTINERGWVLVARQSGMQTAYAFGRISSSAYGFAVADTAASRFAQSTRSVAS
jgi:hypothetical protein